MEIVVLIGGFLLIMCGFSYLESRLSGNLVWDGLKTTLLLIPFAGLALGAFVGNKMGFKETSWEIVVVAIAFQIAYYLFLGFIVSSITSN